MIINLENLRNSVKVISQVSENANKNGLLNLADAFNTFNAIQTLNNHISFLEIEEKNKENEKN